MPPPEPMLSTPTRSWPAGGEWVLQAKWDGFRVLVDVDAAGRPRAWSRHGTSLTDSLAGLLSSFANAPAGSVFDGELIAIAERDGRLVQDFAAVGRAVFAGDAAAARRLRFVAFDILGLGGQDLRGLPWFERDRRMREVLPVCELIRPVQSLPATLASHQAIVRLGFEGTVLKRPSSRYRPGRHRSWRKYKARHLAEGTVVSVYRDRDRQTRAICDINARRVVVLAAGATTAVVGSRVQIVYSRVDAGGGLRESRLATPATAAGLRPRYARNPQ